VTSSIQAFSDMNPSPRAVLDLDPADLDPATDAVTVHQLSKWGDQPVRSFERKALAGGLVVTDYEIPVGVPVTYRVEQFDAAGAPLGFALALAAQVDVPVGKYVVQDPFAPANAVILDGRPGTAKTLTTTRDMQIYQAGKNTIGLASAQRSFLKDVPFVFAADTAEQSDMIGAILDSDVILIRAHPRSRLPGTLYAAVAQMDQIAVDDYLVDDGDDWSFNAQQVSRPALAVIVALISYDLFKQYVADTTAGTYDDAKTIWATYLSALRTPPTSN